MSGTSQGVMDNGKGKKEGKDEQGTLGKQHLSHIERTATEPRDESLHTLLLTKITPVGLNTRLFYLSPLPHTFKPPSTYFHKTKLTWKPGQWVDLYLPGIEKPGGFSITNFPSSKSLGDPSTHLDSSSSKLEKGEIVMGKGAVEGEEREQGIELAIQRPSPQQKVSEQIKYLFQPPSAILNTELQIRIGGSFTWPPPSLSFRTASLEREIKTILFIAGGMGINPLMSIIGYINTELERREENDGFERARKGEAGTERHKGRFEDLEVNFLYSSKIPRSAEGSEGEGEILFLSRLQEIFSQRKNWTLQLFLTNTNTNKNAHSSQTSSSPPPSNQTTNIKLHPSRITPQQIHHALPKTKEERKDTLIYICGPPSMTDEFTMFVRGIEGIEKERVLCERWW